VNQDKPFLDRLTFLATHAREKEIVGLRLPQDFAKPKSSKCEWDPLIVFMTLGSVYLVTTYYTYLLSYCRYKKISH
jgi:hypothetical protein